MTSLYPKGYLTKTELLNLTLLDVSNKSISDLTGIAKLTSLKTLLCNSNNLTSLPTLPSGLTYLSCNNNSLTSLPTLPSGMYFLDCGTNRLTSLPTLPSGLQTLYVNANRFSALTIYQISKLNSFNVQNNTLLTTLEIKYTEQHLFLL